MIVILKAVAKKPEIKLLNWLSPLSSRMQDNKTLLKLYTTKLQSKTQQARNELKVVLSGYVSHSLMYVTRTEGQFRRVLFEPFYSLFTRAEN